MATPAYDLAPLVDMLVIGAAIALLPLAWVWRRHRGEPALRWRALAVLTLFVTFDLVLFGAFTRLTDSGLGCPDWPGCYGTSSPVAAHADIAAAESAMPTGPVTVGKAWVEMIHRYLATAVGGLTLLLAVMSLRPSVHRAGVLSRRWALAAFGMVCLQGAFGALTVTMKLYPAIVTLHLLGGIALLMLLAMQVNASSSPSPVALSSRLRVAAVAVLLLVVVQVALGGWVSTNYAVLACGDFPTCQGRWWPPMDFDHAFTLRRELGVGRDGGFLPFAALTAIHWVHRLGALVVFIVAGAFAGVLARSSDAAVRRFGLGIAALLAWQLATGLGNVVLGWPLVSAVAHTAGAAGLATLMTVLLARATGARAPVGEAVRPTHELPRVAGAGRS